MFHVNPLSSRGFTWNIEHYFIRKTVKKYSRLSSAAVVIGALRVNPQGRNGSADSLNPDLTHMKGLYTVCKSAAKFLHSRHLVVKAELNVLLFKTWKTGLKTYTVELQWLEQAWDHEKWIQWKVVTASQGKFQYMSVFIYWTLGTLTLYRYMYMGLLWLEFCWFPAGHYRVWN